MSTCMKSILYQDAFADKIDHIKYLYNTKKIDSIHKQFVHEINLTKDHT